MCTALANGHLTRKYADEHLPHSSFTAPLKHGNKDEERKRRRQTKRSGIGSRVAAQSRHSGSNATTVSVFVAMTGRRDARGAAR